MAEQLPDELDFVDEIRRYLDRRPLIPFVIVMQSGERYEITGKHQVALGRKAIDIVPPRETHVFFPSHKISSVEVLEPSK
jgi:hypothetical protein